MGNLIEFLGLITGVIGLFLAWKQLQIEKQSHAKQSGEDHLDTPASATPSHGFAILLIVCIIGGTILYFVLSRPNLLALFESPEGSQPAMTRGEKFTVGVDSSNLWSILYLADKGDFFYQHDIHVILKKIVYPTQRAEQFKNQQLTAVVLHSNEVAKITIKGKPKYFHAILRVKDKRASAIDFSRISLLFVNDKIDDDVKFKFLKAVDDAIKYAAKYPENATRRVADALEIPLSEAQELLANNEYTKLLK